MGIFTTLSTAGSGLTAQRMRLDVISDNIANADTTRTVDGGPFRRSRVILQAKNEGAYWNSPFLPKSLDNGLGKGVEVVEIEKDTDSQTRLVYDPYHPDAYKTGPKAGYVEYPNVNVVQEMVDMISASRAYEANVKEEYMNSVAGLGSAFDRAVTFQHLGRENNYTENGKTVVDVSFGKTFSELLDKASDTVNLSSAKHRSSRCDNRCCRSQYGGHDDEGGDRRRHSCL